MFTAAAKKQKACTQLVLPGRSDLQDALMDAFANRRVDWETDAPDCKQLICLTCHYFGVTGPFCSHPTTRQHSYPCIGIIDVTLPKKSGRTPYLYKELQATSFHILAQEAKNRKDKNRTITQFFGVKKKDKKNNSANVEAGNDEVGDKVTTQEEPPNNQAPVASAGESKAEPPLKCQGILTKQMYSDDICSGIIYHHCYYKQRPTADWVIEVDSGCYSIHALGCLPENIVCICNISPGKYKSSFSLLCCKACCDRGRKEAATGNIRKMMHKCNSAIGAILSMSKMSTFVQNDVDILQNFSCNNISPDHTHLSEEGLVLRESSRIAAEYASSMVCFKKKTMATSNQDVDPSLLLNSMGMESFLKDFTTLMQENLEFKSSLIIDLLQIVVLRYKAYRYSKILEQAFNFYST
ncbi:hypothetical protein ACA910_000587 [Epithemia clementina (nom. ined.)]